MNHFHRTAAWKREKQSEGVRDWINEQSIPAFAVGDYNFDWNIRTENGNDAFDIMFEEPGVTWVEPDRKIRTEDSHNSILDFVLVNDAALSWGPESTIIERRDEFTPENEKSDHRPVTAVFNRVFLRAGRRCGLCGHWFRSIPRARAARDLFSDSRADAALTADACRGPGS